MKVNKQLNILYVCCAKTWRGGELQLINLYWGLHKREHKQTIFCVKNSAVETYCINNQIPHITFKRLKALDFLTALQIKKICKRENIDILYLNDPDAQAIAYIGSKLGLKTTSILTRKKVLPIRDSYFTIKKYNAPFIKYIICVSEMVKRIISDKIIDQSRLVVVHEGIVPPVIQDLPDYKIPQNISDKKFDHYIGYTAAITEEKDHTTFLEVANVLIKEKKYNIGFLIAGEGSDKEKIRNKIIELGLEEHVFLLGFLNNIPSFLTKMDILLFTSRSEAFSISILEALFLHIPIISTTWPGVDEMIEDDKTGLLSPMGDVASLVANTEALLHNTELKKKLTENAYTFVQQYNYQNMADKIEAVFYKALE